MSKLHISDAFPPFHVFELEVQHYHITHITCITPFADFFPQIDITYFSCITHSDNFLTQCQYYMHNPLCLFLNLMFGITILHILHALPTVLILSLIINITHIAHITCITTCVCFWTWVQHNYVPSVSILCILHM